MSTTDDLTGPRRDPDLGRTTAQGPTTEEKSAQVDLAIRARRLKQLDEQGRMIEEAKALTAL